MLLFARFFLLHRVMIGLDYYCYWRYSSDVSYSLTSIAVHWHTFSIQWNSQVENFSLKIRSSWNFSTYNPMDTFSKSVEDFPLKLWKKPRVRWISLIFNKNMLFRIFHHIADQDMNERENLSSVYQYTVNYWSRCSIFFLQWYYVK